MVRSQRSANCWQRKSISERGDNCHFPRHDNVEFNLNNGVISDAQKSGFPRLFGMVGQRQFLG
jgi:hypothetical protein